ncbi:MAG: subclass B3 metallo-beta-lactamase [Acidimicrobiia bacterium]|nr:subclass B3 metallo-beta-lactamase [Acidimicrobiia bacterium]
MYGRIALIVLAGCLAAPAWASVQEPTRRQWTLEALFRRNVGTREQQTTAFPPHKVIGNIWYIGTESLASFLIMTPDGHILINSSYEANVPVLLASVAKLGFKPGDIKIVLGSHAHGDHMEGDAEMKRLTNAQVMAMQEDVPALERMRPGGKPHPIDRVLRDGDTVTLGGTTLIARLTPGHTKGNTTWTMKAVEGGRAYDVVIIGSAGVNPGFVLVGNKDNPQIADEYKQTFRVLRSLPCDVPLASHPAMYNMAEKYRIFGTNPNPFIDQAGYKAELDIVEQVFFQTLEAQQKAATK